MARISGATVAVVAPKVSNVSPAKTTPVSPLPKPRPGHVVLASGIFPPNTRVFVSNSPTTPGVLATKGAQLPVGKSGAIYVSVVSNGVTYKYVSNTVAPDRTNQSPAVPNNRNSFFFDKGSKNYVTVHNHLASNGQLSLAVSYSHATKISAKSSVIGYASVPKNVKVYISKVPGQRGVLAAANPPVGLPIVPVAAQSPVYITVEVNGKPYKQVKVSKWDPKTGFRGSILSPDGKYLLPLEIRARNLDHPENLEIAAVAPVLTSSIMKAPLPVPTHTDKLKWSDWKNTPAGDAAISAAVLGGAVVVYYTCTGAVAPLVARAFASLMGRAASETASQLGVELGEFENSHPEITIHEAHAVEVEQPDGSVVVHLRHTLLPEQSTTILTNGGGSVTTVVHKGQAYVKLKNVPKEQRNQLLSGTPVLNFINRLN